MRVLLASRGRAAVALAAAALLAASCAAPGPTPYRPLTGQFGHMAERIDESAWRVVFYAAPATPRARLDDYVLYRAAQLAREQQAPRFAVLDSDFSREEEPRSIRTLPPPGYERPGAGYGAQTTLTPDRTDHLRPASVRLRAELIVYPFDTAPPAAPISLHVTDRVLAELGPAIEGGRR